MFNTLSNFMFKLPFDNKTVKKLLPNLMLVSTLIPNNGIFCKNLMENVCKSVIVLGTYPLETGNKVTIYKYNGILKDYNFWFLTLKKKGTTIYIPTARVYNSVYEVHE